MNQKQEVLELLGYDISKDTHVGNKGQEETFANIEPTSHKQQKSKILYREHHQVCY